MKSAGFERPHPDDSWLFIKKLGCGAELWVEVWGSGDNEISIEVLGKRDARRYDISKSRVVRHNLKEELTKLDDIGIITGYTYMKPVFYYNPEDYKYEVSDINSIPECWFNS